MPSDAALDLGLPKPARRALTGFAAAVNEAFSPRLRMFALYGSAVHGGWQAEWSDLNLLLVLEAVRTEDLRLVARLAARYPRERLTPVVLAVDDLAPTLAVAPATLLDIRDRQVLLAGENLLAEIDPSLDALLAQLRFELRDKVFGLRGGLMAVLGDAVATHALLRRAYNSVLHLLRNLMRLYGRTTDGNPVQAMGDVARCLRIDLGVLRQLHALRGDGQPVGRERLPHLAQELLSLTAEWAERTSELPSGTWPLVPGQTAPSAPDLAAELLASGPAAEAAGEPAPEPSTEEPSAAEPAGAADSPLAEVVPDFDAEVADLVSDEPAADLDAPATEEPVPESLTASGEPPCEAGAAGDEAAAMDGETDHAPESSVDEPDGASL